MEEAVAVAGSGQALCHFVGAQLFWGHTVRGRAISLGRGRIDRPFRRGSMVGTVPAAQRQAVWNFIVKLHFIFILYLFVMSVP